MTTQAVSASWQPSGTNWATGFGRITTGLIDAATPYSRAAQAGKAAELMDLLGSYGDRRVDLKGFLEGDISEYSSDTAQKNSVNEGLGVATSGKEKLDELLSVVRGFESLAMDWDGEGSVAPSSKIIEDTLVVLQNWSENMPLHEPEVTFDGHVILEVYDDEGFTLGGIEFVGDHLGVFSLNSRTEVLKKGTFDTTSQSQIISQLADFKAIWSSLA